MPRPVPKSERLLNLLIMLLVQRRPIAKERIRELLYEQGFTISGARNRLRELVTGHGRAVEQQPVLVHPAQPLQGQELAQSHLLAAMLEQGRSEPAGAMGMEEVKEELLQIRALLSL